MVRSGLFLLFFSLLTLPSLAQESVQVASVPGPTLVQLSDGRVVRLLGIDPLTNGSQSASDCQQYLQLLIGGKTVQLLADSLVADTPSDTILRYLYLDSVLVNIRMIADGYALETDLLHSKRDEFHTTRVAHLERERSGRETSEESSIQTSQEKKSSTSESHSVQCSGRTKKGARCKRMTTNASGKCWQHE